MSWLRRVKQDEDVREGASAPHLQAPPPPARADRESTYGDSADAAWRPIGQPRATRAIAEVYGPTVIPAITVGVPSPAFEPSAIDPSFRPMPFRPDTVVDGWSADGITTRGASLRGHQHRYSGAPREDDFAVHRLPDGRVIVLVADGVSEARQSHIGSAQAVRSASEWFHTSLPPDAGSTDWQHCFASVAWALSEQAQRLLGLPAPDPVVTEEYLATTLVCAVVEVTAVGTLRAHIASVGDSSAWLLSDGIYSDVLRMHHSSPSGIATSEVTGLPRVPSDLNTTVVEAYPGDVLLFGTDGFGDPLGSGDGGVGNLFRDILGRPLPPSLTEFAHGLDFSREAFDDDRTLVAVWPSSTQSHRGSAR